MSCIAYLSAGCGRIHLLASPTAKQEGQLEGSDADVERKLLRGSAAKLDDFDKGIAMNQQHVLHLLDKHLSWRIPYRISGWQGPAGSRTSPPT